MGCWEDWRPIFAMVTVEVAIAAMNSMIKKVIDEGMNRLVLITYRQLVATLFMVPLACFTERKTRPKLTAKIFVYLFFSAMLGASLTQYLFFFGMQFTSVTFSCAFLNMAPVFTFLIAVPFRFERVNLKSKAGIAKVLGTFVCLAGAMLLTFYKGFALTSTSYQLAKLKEHSVHIVDTYNNGKWVLGIVSLFAGTFSWSLWFLLQSKVNETYPALYSGTALIFFLSFLQAAVLSFSMQGGFSIWVLKGKEIITVIFSGIVGSGFCFLAMSWVMVMRGPVFAAAFSPLIQIVVAGIDISILHEQLYFGSVLGSVFVIAGMYFLLWGKSKDAQSNSEGKQTLKNSEEKPSEEDDKEIHGSSLIPDV